MDSGNVKLSAAEVLHDLLIDNRDLVDFLNELAQLSATQVINDNSALCGILLLRDKRQIVVGHSNDKARSLDEIQAGFDEGPCLEAQSRQTIIRVPDVRDEKRWPDYMATVRESGMKSILAVPLKLEGGRVAMNIYSPETGSFSEADIERARQYASLASRAVTLALRIASHAETAEDRRRAMESRTVINLAVGIIMGQNRCSQDQAFEILRSTSNHRNVKLRQLAEDLVASVGQTSPTTTFDD